MILRSSRMLFTRLPLILHRCKLSAQLNEVNKLKPQPYYRLPSFYQYFSKFLEENNLTHLVSKDAAFQYNQTLKELEEVYEIVEKSSPSDDDAFVQLARTEAETLSSRLLWLQDEIINRDVIQDDRNVEECTIQIRAGVGGKEATLFAEELFQLYLKFIAHSGWTLRTEKQDFDQVDLQDNTSLSSHTVEVVGFDSFRLLRHEAGIHRVQRVPKTERYGRVHTSTASILVIPIRANLIVIKDSDLKFDVKNSSGAGGQNVNRNLTCVRVTHLPTGHVTESQETRSQLENKEIAVRKLKALLNQLEYDRRDKEARQQKRVQVGISARSDKIRTYNFPQNRITDHRLANGEDGEGGSWHNIEAWMNGLETKKMREVMERLEAARHDELARQMRQALEMKFVKCNSR